MLDKILSMQLFSCLFGAVCFICSSHLISPPTSPRGSLQKRTFWAVPAPRVLPRYNLLLVEQSAVIKLSQLSVSSHMNNQHTQNGHDRREDSWMSLPYMWDMLCSRRAARSELTRGHWYVGNHESWRYFWYTRQIHLFVELFVLHKTILANLGNSLEQGWLTNPIQSWWYTPRGNTICSRCNSNTYSSSDKSRWYGTWRNNEYYAESCLYCLNLLATNKIARSQNFRFYSFYLLW